MPRRLTAHVPPRELPELVVDERNQTRFGVPVARGQLPQQLRDVVGRWNGRLLARILIHPFIVAGGPATTGSVASVPLPSLLPLIGQTPVRHSDLPAAMEGVIMQSVGDVALRETAVKVGGRAVARSGNVGTQGGRPSRRPPSTEPRRAPEDQDSSLFCQHHALIQDVLRAVIRRRRLNRQDAEDFTGTVFVRLLEEDCAVLRSFQARSSLRTFLLRVIDRMLLDYRTDQWGKWRPSTHARRLGKVAIRLEMLIARDGLTFAEAAESLRTNDRVVQTVEELRALNSQLPPRHRRRFVPCSQLESLPAALSSPEDTLSRPEPSRLRRALRLALATLSAEERILISQRFERDLRLKQLADLRGISQTRFYRDFASLLGRLKTRLEEHGVQAADVQAWPERQDTLIRSVLRFRRP
jgi:RNA polymerase sigma factor (sigma-70 family)